MFNFNAFPITLLNFPKSSERTGYLSESARITNFQSKYSVEAMDFESRREIFEMNYRRHAPRTPTKYRRSKANKEEKTINDDNEIKTERAGERRKAKLQKETENDLKHIN